MTYTTIAVKPLSPNLGAEIEGVDLSKPIINSCGSGVTAAILALAQSLAGHDDSAVYDGSWSEWGKPESGAPVVTG